MIFGKAELLKDNIFSAELPKITKEVLFISQEWDSHIIVTGEHRTGKTTLMQSITENNSILEHVDVNKNFIYNLQNNGYIGLDELQIYPLEKVNDFIDLANRIHLKMVWVVKDQALLSKEIQEIIEKLNFIQVLIE